MNKVFKTPKGTELPLLNLKGKDYLQVAHRLVWFREQEPNGTITTELLEHNKSDNSYAVFRASISVNNIERSTSMVLATATKQENEGAFGDYLEKAETGAIGRALALAGYGTQFAEADIEEGDRLADAPVMAKVTPSGKNVSSATTYAKVAVDKKLITKEDLSRKLQDNYQVSSIKELSDAQAGDLLTSLKTLVDGKK